jgi:O-antigen/teichoic acid export membrane protein
MPHDRFRRISRVAHVRPTPTGRARKGELAPGRSLVAQAGGAIRWSLINNVLVKVCTVGVGVVLARLLGPHSFGTFAVASVALNIMSNFNDLGVSLAIVRWPGEPREITPTVTTISVITSMLLYVGCYFGAPLYSAAMGAPSATSVVRALSLVILIDGFATAPIGLLQRYFLQGRRTIADQVNIWLGTSVTLSLALAGFGPMSLALGRVVGCLAAAVLLVRFSPEPFRFGFNRRHARALLRFGLPLAGSGVVAFAIANVDQLVVGRTLGVTALGFFVLAANLASWPSAAFAQPIGAVAPTALARLQHDRRAMCGGFETMVALVSAVTLPVCLVEAGSAAPLIRMVYGTRWLLAAHVLIWLAPLAALQIFFVLTFDFFVVLAMSRVIFTLQLVWLVVLVPGLIAGARVHGIAGVALAELAVAATVPLPWYFFELRKVGISGRALALRLGLPMGGGGLAGLVAAGAFIAMKSPLPALCCGALAGLVIIGLLLLRMRHVLGSLRQRYVRPGEPAPAWASGGGDEVPSEAAEVTSGPALAAAGGAGPALPRGRHRKP